MLPDDLGVFVYPSFGLEAHRWSGWSSARVAARLHTKFSTIHSFLSSLYHRDTTRSFLNRTHF